MVNVVLLCVAKLFLKVSQNLIFQEMSNAVEVKFDDGSGAMCVVGAEGILCNSVETSLEEEDFMDNVDNEFFQGFQLIPIPEETKKFYLVHVSKFFYYELFTCVLFLVIPAKRHDRCFRNFCSHQNALISYV